MLLLLVPKIKNMDSISLQRIDKAHPAVTSELRQILKECGEKLTGRAFVRFTHTTRSFFDQNSLYALGRTVVNPDGKSKSRPMGYKVTNARGGDSIHNYGLAVDICLIIDGKEASWNDVKDFDGDGVADWMEVVAVFKKYGWVWGGDWSSFIDKPHFEKTFGYRLNQLKEMYNKKQFIAGTTFPAIKVVQPPAAAKIKRVTASGLNLRSGAGTNNSVITVLPRNTEVSVISETAGWSEVIVGQLNKKGWVSSSHIM